MLANQLGPDFWVLRCPK